jgi:hypothetical protein
MTGDWMNHQLISFNAATAVLAKHDTGTVSIPQFRDTTISA